MFNPKIGNLLRQHDILLTQGELLYLLIKDNSEHSKTILLGFKNYYFFLKEHLLMEDEVLYPLLELISPEIKALSDKFQYEIGGLMHRVNDFMVKWVGENLIRENNEDLIFEFEQFLFELKFRIRKENEVLFPLI